jgi:hypothetical protein
VEIFVTTYHAPSLRSNTQAHLSKVCLSSCTRPRYHITQATESKEQKEMNSVRHTPNYIPSLIPLQVSHKVAGFAAYLSHRVARRDLGDRLCDRLHESGVVARDSSCSHEKNAGPVDIVKSK